MIKNARTIAGCTLVLALVTLLACQAAPPTAPPTPLPPTPTPEPEPWLQKANMLSAVGGPAASVVEGKIYVFGGGRKWGGSCLGTVQVYDPATDSWLQ